MAINKVNTTAEEKSFKFLTNQSTILRTAETNKITINGVNVIVEKPKVGDVMCVTKYKNDSGTLLDADKQKVIWIDGLSINPDYLSEEYEPVGICMVVNGNKALVKYREEKVLPFSDRLNTLMQLPESSYMNSGHMQNAYIHINGFSYGCQFTHDDTLSRYHFVRRLNEFFSVDYPQYSADLVELDSEISVSYVDCDKKDSDGNYYNRIIITSSDTTSNLTINFETETEPESIQAFYTEIKSVKTNNHIYKKNGFDSYNNLSNSYKDKIGCNFAAYYSYCASYGDNPSSPLTSINTDVPVSYNYFERSSYKDSSYYDSLLHNTFDNYEDYVDSFMIKYPCGKGIVADDPSGKESTYKLGNSTYGSYNSHLYPAAYYAAHIDVNAPNLGAGNWWIPSVSEMAQMMRDITYGVSAFGTKLDIVNNVLSKLTSSSYFNKINASHYNAFTSSFYKNNSYDDKLGKRVSMIYYYGAAGFKGVISSHVISYGTSSDFKVTPITIYEF